MVGEEELRPGARAVAGSVRLLPWRSELRRRERYGGRASETPAAHGCTALRFSSFVFGFFLTAIRSILAKLDRLFPFVDSSDRVDLLTLLIKPASIPHAASGPVGHRCQTNS